MLALADQAELQQHRFQPLAVLGGDPPAAFDGARITPPLHQQGGEVRRRRGRRCNGSGTEREV